MSCPPIYNFLYSKTLILHYISKMKNIQAFFAKKAMVLKYYSKQREQSVEILLLKQ